MWLMGKAKRDEFARTQRMYHTISEAVPSEDEPACSHGALRQGGGLLHPPASRPPEHDERKVDLGGGLCDLCGAAMHAKRGRYGLFWGCTAFPRTGCKFTRKASNAQQKKGGGKVVLEMESKKEVRVYMWRALCGPSQAAAIGGRTAGDECEEQPLRMLLRKAQLKPLRYDWRDDGIYGGVFALEDYDLLQAGLSAQHGVSVIGIPYAALTFFRHLSSPEHSAQEDAKQNKQWLERLPRAMRSSLLPFQEQGVACVLSRGGRLLLADDMGLGKTVQALGAACALEAWPLLVVCPATLRLVWAEEVEKWLGPLVPPGGVHVIGGSSDKLSRGGEVPRVTIVSYNMLRILR